MKRTLFEWILGRQIRVVVRPRPVPTFKFTPEEARACRRKLMELVPPLIAKWEPVIGVKVAEWRMRQMKTRWGTCNIKARRIWLNLELAKRPVRHVEFILVHEMVHLLERRHNARFKAFMDQFLPDWRTCHAELKARGTDRILDA